MSIDIRLPNITATDTEGKMSQMQSYMHQLVEQLNWALSTVDNAIQGNTSNVVMTSQSISKSEEEAADTFNSIKALIIKSADIVTAYEETMMKDFNGKYFAESDFGKYLEETHALIEENSHNITETFNKVETITNTDGNGILDKLDADVRETNTYIKRGYLGEYINGDRKGQTANGIAVGETITNANGLPEFKGCAWFTAGRLSFLDESNYEVAYISSNKLYITDAVFQDSVIFRNYKVDTSDGLAFLWIGG